MEKRKFYIRIESTLVEVTEEVYLAYYRPVWRTHKHAQRHRRCFCSDWKKCSGDCGLCGYRAVGDMLSYDKLLEDLERAAEFIACRFAQSNTDTTAKDEYEELIDRIPGNTLADRINDLPEEDKHICECVLLGLTERESAIRIGMSQSSFNRMKTKLLARLRAEWSDLC